MTTESLGAGSFTVTADASSFRNVFDQSGSQFKAFAEEAVKDYNRLDVAGQKHAKALIRQANMLGMTRKEQIMYNAEMKNMPTSILSVLSAKLDQVEDKTRKSAKEAMSLNKAIGMLSAGAATLGLMYGVKRFVSETSEYERVITQLDASLKSTGERAGWTQTQLVKMASNLSAVSGKSLFSQGELIDAQTALLGFSNVVGDQVPKAMQAAIDTATKLKMDVPAAAKLVGRALQEPGKALQRLTTQGATFTDEQKKLITVMMKTGDIMGAQGVVLSAIESSFGGAAAAARDTFGGSIKGVQQAISNLLTGDSGNMKDMQHSFDDLINTLNSQEVKDGAATIIGFLADVISFGAKALVAIGDTTRAISYMFASAIYGPDDPIEQLEVKRNKLTNEIQNIHSSVTTAYAAQTAKITTDQLNKELAQVEQTIKQMKFDRLNTTVYGALGDESDKNSKVTLPIVKGGDASKGGRSRARATVDGGTRMLEQLQQKNSDLVAQMNSDMAKLLSSEKELVKFETRLAQIKSRDILTADEGSLLSKEQQIRVALDLNIVTERALELKKEQIKLEDAAVKESLNLASQIEAIHSQAANKRSQSHTQYDDQLEALGLGANAIERVEAQKEVIESFQDMFDDLEKSAAKAKTASLTAGVEFDSSEYDKARSFLQEQLNLRLQDLKDYYEHKEQLEGSYGLGLKKGLMDFAEESKNTLKQLSSIVKGSLDKTADALTDFVSTGKADFKGLADSIIKDLIRMQMQKALTGLFGDGSSGLLGSVLGGIGGGIGSSGGGGSVDLSWATPNALGGVYNSPSLSNYSGQVVSSPTLFAFAKGAGLMGEAGPEAIMPLERTSNGSLGVKAINGGGGGNQITINIHADGSSNASGGGGADDRFLKQLGNEVKALVDERFAKQFRQGGTGWKMAQGRG